MAGAGGTDEMSDEAAMDGPARQFTARWRKLEEDVRAYLSERVAEFQRETGAGVEDVDVDLEHVYTTTGTTGHVSRVRITLTSGRR
jgi:hypothetical protein